MNPAPDDCHGPTSAQNSTGGQLWLIVLALLSVSGIASYVYFDREVFPSAAIDLKLTRQQAAARSAEIAALVGYHPDGALKSTTFTYNQGMKTFLEYELGIEKANRLMRNEFPVWLWSTRFCTPLNKEELTVALTTQGELNSINHVIGNDEEKPSVSHSEAQKIAERFVREQAHLNFDGYSMTLDGSQKRAKRVDHKFTWVREVKEINSTLFSHGDAHRASMSIDVVIAGNQINQFHHSVGGIDSWTRGRIHSFNWIDKRLCQQISIHILAAATRLAAYCYFDWG